MTLLDSKLGAVAFVLVSTWGTAHADDFRVTVSPTVAIDNVQIYSERLPNGGIGNPAPARDNTVLTPNFGTLSAGGTFSTFVSTSYGTSTSAQNNGDYANFSVVATTSTAGVVVGGGAGNSSFNFNDAFPGVNQGAVRSGIVSGTVANVVPLYRAGRQFDNNLFGYQQQTATVTGGLYGFDATGAFSRIGTFSITPMARPVPEPSALAAVGLGAFALLRRRRSKERRPSA